MKFQFPWTRVISEPGPCLYRLDDRYLELWAAKYIFKALERKFQSAEQLFLLEQKAADVFNNVINDRTVSES